MGRVHEGIDARLRGFVERPHVFFVATAPLDGGHVNVSPKGVGGTFTVVDEHRDPPGSFAGAGEGSSSSVRVSA